MMRSIPRLVGVVGATLALLGTRLVIAQDRAEVDHAVKRQQASTTDESVDAISARKLFLEGRTLLDQNKPRDACVAFQRSYKLVAALATLLNLGLCHNYIGNLATAHDYYRQAEVLATLQKDTRRREFAHNEAASLGPRRATLSLRISGNQDETLDVRLDDISQPPEVWASPMFVDAGEHRVSVFRGRKLSWQGTVFVADGNKNVLVIPELGTEPSAATPPPAPPAPPAPLEPYLEPEPLSPVTRASSAQPTDGDSGLGASRIAALAVAGGGGAAVGVALAFTISASSTYGDSEKLCGRVCSPEGGQLRDAARDDAGRATALAIAGGALLASGLVWWLLATPATAAKPSDSMGLMTGPGAVGAQWHGSL